MTAVVVPGEGAGSPMRPEPTQGAGQVKPGPSGRASPPVGLVHGVGLAVAHDHEVGWPGGDDRLALVARGPERAQLVTGRPPVGAVADLVDGVPRSLPAPVVDPALGRSRCRPTPSRRYSRPKRANSQRQRVHERRGDEGAGLVEAGLGRRHADGYEQAVAGSSRVASAPPRASPRSAGDDVAGARGVVEPGAGLGGERPRRWHRPPRRADRHRRACRPRGNRRRPRTPR